MEKIETNNEEIKNEGNALAEPVAEIFPNEILPEKAKIKKKRIYKKKEKVMGLKMEGLKIEEPKIEEPKFAEPLIIEPKITKSIFTEPEKISKKGSKWLKIVLIAFILGCILGLSGTAFYFYRQYKKVVLNQNVILNEEEKAAKESQSIKETIGQFMELPTDEDPVLATVTDIEKIKTQPFFANAQNGDKVLIYTKNKRVILYRPSIGKIIEASIITGGEGGVIANPVDGSMVQDNETAPAVPVENISANSENISRVAIYNGGKISGLAQRIGDRIALIAGVTVSEKTNAVGNYEKNLVIDLSGNRGELAQKIAEALGGEVGTLPEGETKPEADILVIAAKE